MKPARTDALIESLHSRFEKNMGRHKGLAWAEVLARLQSSAGALKSLGQMEESGGEPDVIGQDGGQFIFCDCAAESPTGRRSLCFDDEALNARKENKPQGSAGQAARDMGIELLTEAQYRGLQELGEFDLKTSSWIATPQEMRSLGGALFCDRRFDTVFVYHNGAESYYSGRSFRGWLKV